MRVSERFAPVAAAVSAIGALACCLPFGIAGAMGALGLSVFFERVRPWLIGFAFVLLAVGVFQMVRRQKSCQKRSRFSIALLVFCAAIVLSILLFPQQVASLMADLDFRRAR
jgi:cytochrome bd-type quinol oxidase subunit 2